MKEMVGLDNLGVASQATCGTEGQSRMKLDVMASLPSHLQASSGISDTPAQKNQSMLKLRELTSVQAFILAGFRPASIFRA